MHVYGRAKEVGGAHLKLVFGIGTWPSTHILSAQASYITKSDVKDVTKFNPTMV